MEPGALKELVEGKFVDALRAVAAEMAMEELHEQRGDYVRRVRAVVAGDLLQNGLELEAVSLTQLDQTAMEYFNPSNAFDAEGLTRLTEQIERRKKRHEAKAEVKASHHREAVGATTSPTGTTPSDAQARQQRRTASSRADRKKHK